MPARPDPFWVLCEEEQDELRADLHCRGLNPEVFARVHKAVTRPRGGAPRVFDIKALSKTLGLSASRLEDYLALLIQWTDAYMDHRGRLFYNIPVRTRKALGARLIPLNDWVRAWTAVVRLIEQVEAYHLYRDYEFRHRGQCLSVNKIKALYIRTLNKRGIPRSAYIIKVALKFVVRPTGEPRSDAP